MLPTKIRCLHRHMIHIALGALILFTSPIWACANLLVPAGENTLTTPNFPEAPMGERIKMVDGKPIVPDHPILTWLEGEGIGPEISAATRPVLDLAVELAYKNQRKISWYQIPFGAMALEKFGHPMPTKSFAALRNYAVGIKGPYGTMVGGGGLSYNVSLRQELDLYACVRPVSYLPNVPSPMVHPEHVNMVIFRENTEDIYRGIEFAAGTPEAEKLRHYINELILERDGMKANLIEDRDFALGIKPISEFGTKRLMRRALNYAIENKIKDITVVHKGNIMKHTEGAFLRWSYEVATELEFKSLVITEDELRALNWKMPAGKTIVLKERIADNMLQQTKLNPRQHGILVAPNLNGDYLSDDLAALVGGLGVAPGSNVGDGGAIFEATHGTAPDIAGKNMANPSSLILSGAMMLDYLGWTEAGNLVRDAIRATLEARIVTGDLRNMTDAQVIGTTEFSQKLQEKMREIAQ